MPIILLDRIENLYLNFNNIDSADYLTHFYTMTQVFSWFSGGPLGFTQHDDSVHMQLAGGKYAGKCCYKKNILTGIPDIAEQCCVKFKCLAQFHASNVWSERFIGITDAQTESSNGFQSETSGIRIGVCYSSPTAYQCYLQLYTIDRDVCDSLGEGEFWTNFRLFSNCSDSTCICEDPLTFNPFIIHFYEIEVFYSKTPGQDTEVIVFCVKIDGQPYLAHSYPFKSSLFKYDQGANFRISTCVAEPNQTNYGIHIFSMEVDSN